MIKYCDKCKFNTLQCSKEMSEKTNECTIEVCPVCGDELYTADNFEDIP